MAIVEHERNEAQVDVEELERLWTAPAAERAARRLPRVPLDRLPRVVGVAWCLFVVAIFALEPAANPDAVVPLWAEATLAAFWLGLLDRRGAGEVRRVGPALGLSAFAGAVGVGLGYACGATEHHLGAWWIAEAGVCGALALLSGAALLGRRRA